MSDKEWYNEWQRMIAKDSEWQQVTKIDNKCYSDWRRVVQGVTKNDNEWQRVTTDDNEWQGMAAKNKKWQRVIKWMKENESKQKRKILFQNGTKGQFGS